MLPVRFSRVFVAMSVLLLWSIAFVSSGASAGAAVAPQAASGLKESGRRRCYRDGRDAQGVLY